VSPGSREGKARCGPARTAYPTSEPLQHNNPITCIQFSPDGHRCLSIAGLDAVRLWDVRDSPVPVPVWFCEFVEAVAGMRCNEHHDAAPDRRGPPQYFTETV